MNLSIWNKERIKKLVIAILWILLWELLYLIVGKDLLIPSPLNTFRAFVRLFLEPVFYVDIIVTVYRVVFGIGISFILGIITALISYKIEWIEAFLEPFVRVLKTIPVLAIIILALLWFQSGNVPIFICFLMCYPVIYTNVLTGLKKVDRNLLEMCKVFKVKQNIIIQMIYIPHLKSYIEAALKLVAGLSWKVVIAAEVLSVPKYSMGYNVLNAKVYLESEVLFAWIIVIVIFSSVCEKGVIYLISRKEKTRNDSNKKTL